MMPVDLTSFLMGKVWRLVGPLNHRHKRALRHMEWALAEETTAVERETLTREMWENLGRTFAEALISDQMLQKKNRFIIDEEKFRQWHDDSPKGSLLVTHHFGNWELVSAAEVLNGTKQVMGVYKHVKNPFVEGFLHKIRAPLFTGGLFSQRNQAVTRMVEHIRNNKDIAMVADLRDVKGMKVNLFNMPTPVTTFPAAVAVRYQKPLFVVQLRRTKGAFFTTDIEKITVTLSGEKTKDIETITQAIHSQFESWIRQNPSQWMWAPYRWTSRHDPIGKPTGWSEFIQLKERKVDQKS